MSGTVRFNCKQCGAGVTCQIDSAAYLSQVCGQCITGANPRISLIDGVLTVCEIDPNIEVPAAEIVYPNPRINPEPGDESNE